MAFGFVFGEHAGQDHELIAALSLANPSVIGSSVQSMSFVFRSTTGVCVLFPPAEKTLESGFLHGEMLDMIADGFSAGLMVYDADDKILYASRKIHQMLNIPVDCLDVGASLRT